MVDKAYFGRQLKKFCGGFESKRGKIDGKNVTKYKGLIFHESESNAAIEALRQSVSQVDPRHSQVNLRKEEEEQVQKISISQVSQANTWIEILERFGQSSLRKEPQNSPGKENGNLPEIPTLPEKTPSNEPVGEEPTRENPETLPETKTIEADLKQAEERALEKEAHDREQAAKYTIKRPKSYSDMISLLPKEGSTKEETAILTAMRGLLARGIGPRIDFLAKDTKLPEATIKAILDRSDGIRKDDSSPAGIVVYLPSEASA